MNWNKIIAFVGILALINLCSCEDEYESTVPEVSFRTTLFNLNDAVFIEEGFGISLSMKLDSSYGGYAGLILYQAAEKIIYAYDLCCPIHYEDKEQLKLDGALAFCPTDSVYYPISNGEPAFEIGNGTDPTMLRSYHVQFYSSSTFVVYN